MHFPIGLWTLVKANKTTLRLCRLLCFFQRIPWNQWLITFFRQWGGKS